MVTILTTVKSRRTRHPTTTITTTTPLPTHSTTSTQPTPPMHINTPIHNTAITASIPIMRHTPSMLLTTTVSKQERDLADPNPNTVASVP